MGLPTYCLDQIDETTVTVELQRLGIEIGGRFDREVRRLLQRPFYFQYIIRGAVKLPKEPHPRDFYQIFFRNLHKSFAMRFSEQLDLEKALSLPPTMLSAGVKKHFGSLNFAVSYRGVLKHWGCPISMFVRLRTGWFRLRS